MRLDDALLEQAKREAAKRGETLTSLIELGLRLALAQAGRPEPRSHIELPISTEGGGTLPGIDLTNSAELWDVLDGVR